MDGTGEKDKDSVRFGGGGAASVAGVIAGVCIAIGVPLVLLNFGQLLPQSVLTGLVIAGVSIGGLVSLVSAFFGIVMPMSVSGKWHDQSDWGEWHKRPEKKAGGHEQG